MKPYLLLTVLAAASLVSCTSNVPYRPVTKSEKIEFRNDRLDVYPDDVRQDIARYSKLRVAWAGIIVSNDATEHDDSSRIQMDTVFEHRYFDWEQDDSGSGVRLLISPRGEGFFRMRWHVKEEDMDATYKDAMKYARPGKLAIVYGSPESVTDDGTIIMRYHYIRILGPAHFTANELDYGRLGSGPFRPVDAKLNPVTNAPSR